MINSSKVASFEMFLGQGNTFVLDDWSAITLNRDDDSICDIHLSGQYQRNVKTYSILIEKVDMITTETLYKHETKIDEHEIQTDQLDF